MRASAPSGRRFSIGSPPTPPSLRLAAFPFLFLCIGCLSAFAESYTVSIHVLGPNQEPIPNAMAALFWEARDGVMTPVTDESGVADARGKVTLRFGDRNQNRPVLIFSPDCKLGGILPVSKTNAGMELSITLGSTVRARGKLTCTELNSKPGWANTMVRREDSPAFFAQDMGTAAQFDFVLPPGKYVFNTYGSDVGNHTQKVLLTAEQTDLDLGTIDLKAAPIAKLKGKPAPTWQVTGTRGVKRTARISDYKGKWLYLEFWGFW